MAQAYKSSPDATAIGDKLINQFHQHLIGHRVEFIFYREVVKSQGRIVLGRARLMSGLNAFLGWNQLDSSTGERVEVERFQEPEPFFLIEIWEKSWFRMNLRQKVALVDHELCHCGVETDEEGVETLRIIGHDLEEFMQIVNRHGRDALPGRAAFFNSLVSDQGTFDFDAKEMTKDLRQKAEAKTSVDDELLLRSMFGNKLTKAVNDLQESLESSGTTLELRSGGKSVTLGPKRGSQ